MNLVGMYKKRLNTVEECRRLFAGCILVHGMMVVMFMMLDVKLLAYTNIFSVTYYMIGMLLFPRINRSSVFTLMLCAEFIFNEVLCNIVLGWGYGFCFYGLLLIPIMFYFIYLDKGVERKVDLVMFLSAIDVIATLMSCIVCGAFNKFDNIRKEGITGCFFVNMVVCMLAFVYYSGRFLIEMNLQTKALYEKNRELNFRANHDPVTGLYNRERFFEAAAEIIKRKPERKYRIVCSDIKDFKLINDMYGDEMGNQVLRFEADLIREYADSDAVYGRISGDRFALCMPAECFDENMIVNQISKLKEMFNKSNYHMHIYIGVYDVVDVNEAVGTMCDKALISIQNIKGDYYKVVSYYDWKLLDHELQKRQLVGEFEKAVSEEQFCIYLQPQTDRHGKCYGSEALVRWKHPERGLIMPGYFIEPLEEAGLIYRLDEFVWELAVRQLKKWKDAGREDMYISVNISARDFYYIDVYKVITGLVKKYEISPSSLRLELTETALASDLAEIMELLTRLKNKGFIIEIDDFGSGYSSLNMLKDICADVVKIDREFLRETENAKRSKDILEVIITLSKKMNMTVVAEGVETLQQVNMLAEMGCEIFQGYYFSKPISVPDFEEKYM